MRIFLAVMLIVAAPNVFSQLKRVANAPPVGGTFYSMQKTNQPPLPFNPFPELDLYLWGDIFLFDDSEVDYSAAKSSPESESMSTLEGGPPVPGGGGGGGGPVNSTNVPPAYSHGSNALWLRIAGRTNASAALVIYTPTNGLYDLFYTTNLGANVPGWNFTNRSWIYRTASGETNLSVTNLWSAQGYFNLGTMLDSDSDGLTDAYENLTSHTNPNNLDTDADGMPDGWEVAYGLNPLAGDGNSDSDGDGIGNYDEWRYGLDPTLDDARQPGKSQEFRYDIRSRLSDFFAPTRHRFLYDAEGNITQVIVFD
jgi:hypothetical protein